jgi:hypothetical protein
LIERARIDWRGITPAGRQVEIACSFSRQIGVLQDVTVVKCYVDAGQPYVIN